MVLLTCNSATAILVSSGLAICLLGEKFVWKYDLTALVLYIIGGTLTIVQANRQKTERTPEEIRELLSSPASITFYAFAAVLLLVTCFIVR